MIKDLKLKWLYNKSKIKFIRYKVVQFILFLLFCFCLFYFISHIRKKKEDSFRIIKTSKNIKENNDQQEELILNPRMKIKDNNNKIYDIEAEKIFYQKNNIIIKNIKIKGINLEIEAGEAEILDSGNIIKFSKNPYVIIKPSTNK
jgi:hypothetical protein